MFKIKSNTMDTNLYTNLCNKITRGNSGNTRGKYGDTRDMPYQLKLNSMNCQVIYQVRFGAQIGAQVSVPSIIY